MPSHPRSTPKSRPGTSTWATRPMVRDTPGMSAWSLSQLNSAHPPISAKEIALAAKMASASETPTADSITLTLYIAGIMHICVHAQTFDSLYTFS